MKNFADIKKDSVHIGGRIVYPEQIMMLELTSITQPFILLMVKDLW